jgi:hypothetical protein
MAHSPLLAWALLYEQGETVVGLMKHTPALAPPQARECRRVDVVLPDDIKQIKRRKTKFILTAAATGTVAAAATTPTATKGHSQVEHSNASNKEKKKAWVTFTNSI